MTHQNLVFKLLPLILIQEAASDWVEHPALTPPASRGNLNIFDMPLVYLRMECWNVLA